MQTPKYTLTEKAGAYGIVIEADGEISSAEDVTRSKERAEWLYKLLSENTVYPENLPEILDDLLGVEIWE